MELTLGDLLDHTELGLHLVTSDVPARKRPVRGAHPIEINTPTRWVPRDWVMLTNGLRLRGRPEEQRALVAELDEGGQAALGWAVGTVMQRVPRALVAEARRREFPVFLVPIETAFHQIVSFLGGARAHDDVYVMQRVAAMEDYLMDALGTAQPEQAAVRRLASLLGGEVLLATAAGEPVETSGATPDERLRAAIAAQDTEALAALLGGTPQVAIVRSPDAQHRVLVAVPADEHPVEIARPLLHRAAQVLQLLGAQDARHAQATRRKAADLLARLLDTPQEDDAAVYDAEAVPFGVQPDTGVCAAVWQPVSSSERAPADIMDAFLTRVGMPHLVAEREGFAVALVQACEEDLVSTFETSREAAGRTLGVGAQVRSLRDFATSLTGAHLALLCLGGDVRVRTYSSLDPMTRMLVTAARTGELDDLRAVLDPLRAKPHLRDALTCWLDTGGDSTAAAARLHLHRNSLRYRLSRVEHLTSTSLSSPTSVANLELALLADALHARLHFES